jgi:hypothetical protein
LGKGLRGGRGVVGRGAPPPPSCPLMSRIDDARRSIALHLMDARAASARLTRALALADTAYADLAESAESLRHATAD